MLNAICISFLCFFTLIHLVEEKIVIFLRIIIISSSFFIFIFLACRPRTGTGIRPLPAGGCSHSFMSDTLFPVFSSTQVQVQGSRTDCTRTRPCTIQIMEDFDYVGTGGFVIECQAGEHLGVTKEQAQVVRNECIFFQKCFDHDMVENREKVVRKPDWSLSVTRHLIEALTKGRTTLPSLELYQHTMSAADQALIDLRLCSFVNYMDPTQSKHNRFFDLVSDEERYYCFKLKGKVTSDQWLRLLETGILLNRENTNYVVQLYKDQTLTQDQMLSRRKLDTRFSEYRVHADRSIQATMEIREALADSPQVNSLQGNREEQYCVYFETTECIPKEHNEMIDRLTGGQAYIRTCADAAEFQTEGYTIRASLDVLKRSIEPLINGSNSLIDCSLRVDNPTPDTLGRLINACKRAETFPGTIGLDVAMNRYFCRKTLRDIYSILNYLADFSLPARVQDKYTIHVLSSEDEPF